MALPQKSTMSNNIISETPEMRYDPYEEKLTILTEKSEYLRMKKKSYPDIYNQIRFLYIFGSADKQLCVKLLEQIKNSHKIDMTIYDNMGSIDPVMNKILANNCIRSDFPIPNPITNKFPHKRVNGKNQVTVKLNNLSLTEEGNTFYQNLLQKCDIILPDIGKNLSSYEEVLVPKIESILEHAEKELGL